MTSTLHSCKDKAKRFPETSVMHSVEAKENSKCRLPKDSVTKVDLLPHISDSSVTCFLLCQEWCLVI